MKFPVLASLTIAAISFSTYSFAADPLVLEVVNAERKVDQNNRVVLSIQLNENSGRLFGSWTSQHVGEKADMLINGRIVYTARLLAPIMGGGLIVSGPSEDEINAWISKLRDGQSVLSVNCPD